MSDSLSKTARKTSASDENSLPSIYVWGNKVAEATKAQAPQLYSFIDSTKFLYCIRCNDRRAFVWTYLLHIRNRSQFVTQLVSRDLQVNQPGKAVANIIRSDNKDPKLSFWRKGQRIEPGAYFDVEIGIVFDEKLGTLNGSVEARFLDQPDLYRLRIHREPVSFDFNNAQNKSEEIVLDNLCCNGKLSEEGAHLLVDYMERIKESLTSGKTELVDFGQVSHLSDTDCILLNNYLILSTREEPRKSRKFSFGPIMPVGLEFDLLTKDHFFLARKNENLILGKGISVTLEVANVIFLRPAHESAARAHQEIQSETISYAFSKASSATNIEENGKEKGHQNLTEYHDRPKSYVPEQKHTDTLDSDIARFLADRGHEGESARRLHAILKSSYLSATRADLAVAAVAITSPGRRLRPPAQITATPEKPKRPRPNLPPGLEWPEGDYGSSPEAKRGSGGGLIPYLERVWLPILEASRRDDMVYVDRRIIADWYPGVIKAMKNYRAPDQMGARREIPEELRFPTLTEVTDKALAQGPAAIAADPKLAQVVASRHRRGMAIPM